MELKWCRLGGARSAQSSVTGRKLFVNESDQFYIPSDRTFDVLPDVVRSFENEHWSTMFNTSKPRGKFLELLGQLSDAVEPPRFAAVINELVEHVAVLVATKDPASSGQTGRLMDLLVRLHAEECLAFPMRHSWGLKVSMPDTAWPWAGNWPFRKRMNAFSAIAMAGRNRAQDYKRLWICRLFLACHGAKEAGDLTPEVDAGLLFRVYGGDNTRNFVPATARLLLDVMRQDRPTQKIEFNPKDYGSNAKPLKSDGTMGWAVAEDPSLSEWATMLAKWLAIATTAYKVNLYATNSFLTYLIQNPSVTRNPLQFVRNDYTSPVNYPDWLELEASQKSQQYREYNNRLEDCFNWMLSEYCSEDGYVSPSFGNPLKRVRFVSLGQSETHRSSMPLQYVRMLKDIIRAPYTVTGEISKKLTDKLLALKYVAGEPGSLVGEALSDNLKAELEEAGATIEYGFRWPRTQRDHFTYSAPGSTQPVEVWSPVRAYLMLLKLELPLRTFQVRVLDSGEADPEMYELGRGWVPNSHPLANRVPDKAASKAQPSTGVIRRFHDTGTGERFNGLYINTNKTADRNKAASKRGYEIPWENKDAIRLLAELGAFQREFNPVSEVLPWSEIAEFEGEFRKEELAERGAATFLFRDPKADNRAHPVTNSRMNRFWKNLLEELEKRVTKSGQLMRDGTPITFVSYKMTTGKNPMRYATPVYDLHSLRVTLITAFAERGVPISILSKFIAGHATVIMTLYYSKFGPAYITEVMNEASKRMDAAEQEDFRRFLNNHAYKQIAQVSAFNDDVAIHALKQANSGSWVSDDRGICPTGCARCYEGGDLKKSTGPDVIKNVYDPVPGGQNCVLCRFFITGPTYLTGLTAHFNETGWRMMEKSARYRELDEKLEAFEDERYLCEAEGRPFLRGVDLEAVCKIYQRVGEELDVLARTWHATKRLMDRCLSIKRDRKDEGETSDRLALVLAGTRGDVEAALVETTAFELADAVCQSAVFYESVDPTTPMLRRADMINAMLACNHRRPIFATLSDSDKLYVGNEMMKMLVARIGREDTLALMAGQETLEHLEMSHAGLAADMDKLGAVHSDVALQITIDHPERLSKLGRGTVRQLSSDLVG